MSNVNYDYDTAAMRREARQISRCISQLESAAIPRIQTARSRLDGNFMGLTAEALDDSLVQAQKKLRDLEDNMHTLYSALMRFADALEEADRALAEKF